MDIWGLTSNGSPYTGGPDANLTVPVRNAFQTALAAARVDIGNSWMKNNFLLNTSLENATLAVPPVVAPTGQGPLSVLLNAIHPDPLNMSDTDVYPAVFNTVYQCQTTQRKSVGSVIISILVATLSLFTSGWGVFMLAAAFLHKRYQTARRDGGR